MCHPPRLGVYGGEPSPLARGGWAGGAAAAPGWRAVPTVPSDPSVDSSGPNCGASSGNSAFGEGEKVPCCDTLEISGKVKNRR